MYEFLTEKKPNPCTPFLDVSLWYIQIYIYIRVSQIRPKSSDKAAHSQMEQRSV